MRTVNVHFHYQQITWQFLSYAEVFSLGLFLMEFIDSVYEGDGNRILRCIWSIKVLPDWNSTAAACLTIWMSCLLQKAAFSTCRWQQMTCLLTCCFNLWDKCDFFRHIFNGTSAVCAHVSGVLCSCVLTFDSHLFTASTCKIPQIHHSLAWPDPSLHTALIRLK